MSQIDPESVPTAPTIRLWCHTPVGEPSTSVPGLNEFVLSHLKILPPPTVANPYAPKLVVLDHRMLSVTVRFGDTPLTFDPFAALWVQAGQVPVLVTPSVFTMAPFDGLSAALQNCLIGGCCEWNRSGVVAVLCVMVTFFGPPLMMRNDPPLGVPGPGPTPR